MESPSPSEISSRLERATRSALASCSFSRPASSSPPGPSLSDLLSQHGPADALRCSHCQAPLLRGPRALFCFACGAPFQISSLPKISFRSSLAHRRLLDSLQIEGLDANSEELGDESSAPGLYASNHRSVGSTWEQESVSHETLPSPFLHPEIENISKILNLGQYTVPSDTSVDSAVSNSERSTEATAYESGHSKKQDSILDYSAKLEGISLEDFFSTQIKSQSTAAVNGSVATENPLGRVEDLQTQNGQKDPFWDPLIEDTISDGNRTTSREFEIAKESLWRGEEFNELKIDNLDDDDSWEGDFQSAAPAIVTNEGFTFGLFNALVMQPDDDNDLFVSSEMETETDGSELNTKRGLSDVAERVPRENTGEDDNDIFALHNYGGKPGPTLELSSETPQETGSERLVDLDDLFFGSIWQQNVAATSMKDAIDEFADGTSVGGVLINSATQWNGQDLTQPSLPNQHDLVSLEDIKATLDNGSYGGESHFKTLGDVFGKEHEAQLQEKANEMVGSLLAQLHDLSFMLAHKLVIKTDNVGKVNQRPDLREQKLLF